MRYHVTLATRALGYVTYEVDGATEEDAKTKAAALFLKKRARFSTRDFAIAKVVEIGVSRPRKRRVRRKTPSLDRPHTPGGSAANAP